MSPTNARALNTMRQRLKKHNVSYQTQIDAFREKPESSEEEVVSGVRSSFQTAFPGCAVTVGAKFGYVSLTVTSFNRSCDAPFISPAKHSRTVRIRQ